MTRRSSLHNIMRKGKPYSEIVVMVVNNLREKKTRQFSIRDFSGIDVVNWRRVLNRLRSEGFITHVKKSSLSGEGVAIYKDCGLIEAFERWNEKYDWEEYLY